jgi:hypothetical protein
LEWQITNLHNRFGWQAQEDEEEVAVGFASISHCKYFEMANYLPPFDSASKLGTTG